MFLFLWYFFNFSTLSISYRILDNANGLAPTRMTLILIRVISGAARPIRVILTSTKLEVRVAFARRRATNGLGTGGDESKPILTYPRPELISPCFRTSCKTTFSTANFKFRLQIIHSSSRYTSYSVLSPFIIFALNLQFSLRKIISQEVLEDKLSPPFW